MTKGEDTRERLLQAAIELFAERGYHATSLKDITSRAGRSPGLAYRYFRQKEDFVLALYGRIADELAQVELPAGPAPARYATVLREKLRLVRPHRVVLAAVVGALIDPANRLGLASDETRAVRDAVRAVVRAALVGADPPAPETWTEPLYAVHLLVLLVAIAAADPRAADATVDLVEQLLTAVPPPLLSALFARAEPIWPLLFPR
ncbi:MAG: helix-turn-helix domain-containing protein [Myxococcota bacterium]